VCNLARLDEAVPPPGAYAYVMERDWQTGLVGGSDDPGKVEMRVPLGHRGLDIDTATRLVEFVVCRPWSD